MPVARLVVCLLLVGTVERWCAAADVPAFRLAPADSVLVVEINRPGRLLDNPLGRDVWSLLRESAGVRQGLASPDVDRLRQAARFIEKSLGVDWQTGLRKLTAGGAMLAVRPGPQGDPPDVTAIITSADDETMRRFVDAVHAEIERRREARQDDDEKRDRPDQPGGPPAVSSSTYRSFTCYRVGAAHYSVVGARLIASNRQEVLRETLDRLEGTGGGSSFEPPAALRLTDAAGEPPMVLATLNLKRLREAPGAGDGLKLPARDVPGLLLFGGYIDLVRRADSVAAGLFADEGGFELRVRLPVGSEGRYAGLKGYFAAEPGEDAAPLLEPPGTLYSGSWFRDYARLWDARAELVAPELVQQLEKENARQQRESVRLGFVDLVRLLGPHFRLVAAEPREAAYKYTGDARLPAAAAAIELRDEAAFREKALPPLERLSSLVVLSTQGEFRSTDHKGAKLSTIRFPEPKTPPEPDKAMLYQFDPTWTVTRGHVVFGSTSEIVRNVIDELDRQAADPAPPDSSPRRLTGMQQLSFAQAAKMLKAFEPRFVEETASRHGMTVEQARRELDIVWSAVRRLGSLTTSATMAPDQFELKIRIGGSP